MRVASLNLNKRLSASNARGRLANWVQRNDISVLFGNEPWAARLQAVPRLPGMNLVGGDHALAAWVRDDLDMPSFIRKAPWWVTVVIGEWRLHGVHLDAYSSKAREQQLRTLAAKLDEVTTNVIAGDFNLAPRPMDGMFGDRLSDFTSSREREAFDTLLRDRHLRDATAFDEPTFTFERQLRGSSSRFRCDLILTPSTNDKVTVAVSNEPRTAPSAFTDHAGLIIDVPCSLRVVAERSITEQGTLFDGFETSPASHAPEPTQKTAFKTAMRRHAPSLPARTLLSLLREWLRTVPTAAGHVLDFGCGAGTDVQFFRDEGLDADGFDPHPGFGFEELPDRFYGVVTMFFVLNVIADPEERVDAVRRAAAKTAPGGVLVVATRSKRAVDAAAARGAWEPWLDGYLSHEGRGTFQRGFDVDQLEALGRSCGLQPIPGTPQVRDASIVAYRRAGGDL